jgi:transposase
MLLFASFQGQSVSQISSMFQASATHVAALIHAFNEQGSPGLDPRWGGGRPRRIDLDARTEIAKVALLATARGVRRRPLGVRALDPRPLHGVRGP